MCFREVEDEKHFMMRCPAYDELRMEMKEKMKNKSNKEDDMFDALMGGEDKESAIWYTQKAMARREHTLIPNQDQAWQNHKRPGCKTAARKAKTAERVSL